MNNIVHTLLYVSRTKRVAYSSNGGKNTVHACILEVARSELQYTESSSLPTMLYVKFVILLIAHICIAR